MINHDAGQRYANALFQLVKEGDNLSAALNELREFTQAVQKDKDLHEFFVSPVIRPEDQRGVLDKLFEKKNFCEEVKGLIVLLTRRRRFSLFGRIASAFQDIVDNAQGVARGTVYSAITLVPEEKQQLEATISRYTSRRAVLEYQEDRTLIGGLIAKVGSYTFDHSLETQLHLMKNTLTKRSAH